MANEVEQLVADTVALLKSKLQKDNPKTANEAATIVHECLRSAFSKVSEADHKKLYQKLSLKLHQDKLEHLQKEIYDVLYPIKAHQIPQQALNEYQRYRQTNFFQNAASNPVEGTKNVLFYLLTQFAPMYFAYERYSQPWQTIVNIINWGITLGLLVGYLGLAASLGGMYFTLIWPALKLEQFFVNAVTNSKFDENVEEFENDPARKGQEKRNTINGLRLNAQFSALYVQNNPEQSWTIEKMTNDELIEALVMRKYTQVYQQDFPNKGATDADIDRLLKESRAAIESEIGDGKKKVDGFRKIALIAQSLFHSIAKPLSNNAGYATLEVILIKPLQVLLTPLMLTASIIIELTNYLNTVLGFALLVAVAAIKITSIAIYNTPLYIQDAILYMKGCCKGTDVKNDADLKKEPSAADDIQSSTQGMYGNKKNSQSEPVEQGGYEKLFKELPSTDSKSQETFPHLSM